MKITSLLIMILCSYAASQMVKLNGRVRPSQRTNSFSPTTRKVLRCSVSVTNTLPKLTVRLLKKKKKNSLQRIAVKIMKLFFLSLSLSKKISNEKLMFDRSNSVIDLSTFQENLVALFIIFMIN